MNILSEILGWSYFTVWSFSFYPQLYLNYKLKTCKAVSKALLSFNIIGFYSYSLYTLLPNDLVSLSDKVFAIHALTLSVIIFIQCYYYDKISKVYIPVLVSIVVILSWIDKDYLGPIKVVITLIKYLPQVYLNFKNSSTIGFSTTGILMDLSGGILSILQLFWDAAIRKTDFNEIFSKNATKLLLSSASLSMDCVLIFQAIIYKNSKQEDVEVIKEFVV